MKLKTKKINGQTKDLKYATDGAVCFDIVSNEDAAWNAIYTRHYDADKRKVTKNLVCYETIIDTGYQFEIPQGFRMDIFPRSGWGFKHNIQLANGTGKIDSDFRGEVKIKLIAFCERDNLPSINRGDRIAQADINPVTIAEFEYVDILEETERGQDGFGSTGIYAH